MDSRTNKGRRYNQNCEEEKVKKGWSHS